MQTLRSYETSFAGLFDLVVDDEPVVTSIEIPMIQRDYAQGRGSAEATLVRKSFLRALHLAAIGGGRLTLDFVYGSVDEKRTLQPLDGQQRLTTLFLLHWYLAARTGRVADGVGWTSFTYETRPSAREFCRRLGQEALPDYQSGPPSEWIRDQHWFLPTWRYDPTVCSMLVVIDELAVLFAADDLDGAWKNLHADDPAISFHLLPIDQMGAPEALYIRMNSRGRPLTEFENIKAVLIKAVDGSSVAEERDLAGKLDGAWLDLLWPLRDADHKVDRQYLNYLRYIVEICELRRDDLEAATLPLVERIERSFTTGRPGADDSVRFLIDAFDTWTALDTVGGYFDEIFASEPQPLEAADDRVVLFSQDGDKNLFEVCCRHYDNTQRFSVRLKLLLYAVLTHRISKSPAFAQRLRMVRNLVEGSGDERRPERVVTQVADVERVIVEGDVGSVKGLNQVQRVDEVEKRTFLEEHPGLAPALHRLEDHDLLRGSLVAFDLDPTRFEARAATFEEVWSSGQSLLPLTGAMLTAGDYHRTIGSSRPAFHFGAPTPSRWWRQLLTGDSRENLASLIRALGEVLDRVDASGSSTSVVLEAMRAEWAPNRDEKSGLDWRHYMVTYPAMRSGASGIFRGKPEGRLGYTIFMLDRENMQGRYCDPFLKALLEVSDVGAAADLHYSELYLTSSELELSSSETGFVVTRPVFDAHRSLLEEIRAERPDLVVVHDDLDRLELRIPQESHDGVMLDTVDRVQLGAAFVRQLVDAGL